MITEQQFMESVHQTFNAMEEGVTYYIRNDVLEKINLERPRRGYSMLSKTSIAVSKVGNKLMVNDRQVELTNDVFALAVDFAAVLKLALPFAFALPFSLTFAFGYLEDEQGEPLMILYDQQPGWEVERQQMVQEILRLRQDVKQLSHEVAYLGENGSARPG